MKQKVLETIKKYNLIEDGDRLVLGVSGGPDSITMLDILRQIKQDEKIKFEIVVAHVNHMIRKEAIEDEQYVEEYCKKNQIKFYLERIDVTSYANNNKMGLEESGRKLRYDFFDEVMKNTKSNKIAIAHNKNDKIETIIMNILRGSGIAGLKGIEPKRNNKYIRPLIECERYEIEDYCAQNDLNPRIDKTNFENDYTRNKIRNIVIPYIKTEFNPNFIETMNRLSNVAEETENYLQKQTKQIYEKLLMEEKEGKIILDLKQFNMEDILIKKRIIIYTISRLIGHSQNIEKVNVEDIVKLCQNNIGNKYLKPNKNVKVLVNKGKIFFEVVN
jgi:tRNA(Ile)-lysidine synthase